MNHVLHVHITRYTESIIALLNQPVVTAKFKDKLTNSEKQKTISETMVNFTSQHLTLTNAILEQNFELIRIK